MAKEKKQPKDYPQFYFRLTEDEKKQIDELVQEILDIELSKHKEGEFLPKRNSIIVRALTRGLKTIKSEKSR